MIAIVIKIDPIVLSIPEATICLHSYTYVSKVNLQVVPRYNHNIPILFVFPA
jgi:hypothetical protein